MSNYKKPNPKSDQPLSKNRLMRRLMKMTDRLKVKRKLRSSRKKPSDQPI